MSQRLRNRQSRQPSVLRPTAPELADHPRSEVSAALREYIARHSPDEVTVAINQALQSIGEQKDEFVSAAARRVLEKTEWS